MPVFQLLLCVFTLIKTQNTPLRIVTPSGALFVVSLSATISVHTGNKTNIFHSSFALKKKLERNENVCQYLFLLNKMQESSKSKNTEDKS